MKYKAIHSSDNPKKVGIYSIGIDKKTLIHIESRVFDNKKDAVHHVEIFNKVHNN